MVFATGVAVAALADTAIAQNSAVTALDTSLRGAVERKDVPGVVALVTDRKGVIYQGAFGVADVSTGRPLTADALFRIASMTKAVTSTALMQLVEQGRVSLDDPAEKYLPELTGLKVLEKFDPATGDYLVRPAAKKPTVRHFLTHTAGIHHGFPAADERDGNGLRACGRNARRRDVNGREGQTPWALAVGSRSRAMLDIWAELRRRRAADRGRIRPVTRPIPDALRLRSCRHEVHIFRRPGRATCTSRPRARPRR